MGQGLSARFQGQKIKGNLAFYLTSYETFCMLRAIKLLSHINMATFSSFGTKSTPMLEFAIGNVLSSMPDCSRKAFSYFIVIVLGRPLKEKERTSNYLLASAYKAV